MLRLILQPTTLSNQRSNFLTLEKGEGSDLGVRKVKKVTRENSSGEEGSEGNLHGVVLTVATMVT